MLDIRSFFLIGALISLICFGMLLPLRGAHARARPSMHWAMAGLLLLASALACAAFSLPDRLSHVWSAQLNMRWWPVLALGLAGSYALYESLIRLADARPWRVPVIGFMTALAAAGLVFPVFVDGLEGVVLLLAAGQAAAVFSVLGLVVPMIGTSHPRMVALVYSLALLSGLCLIVLPSMHLPQMLLGKTLLPADTLALGMVVSGAAIALMSHLSTSLLIGVVNGRVSLEYRKLAAIDTLTGLRGRRAFFEDGGRLLHSQFAASRMTCMLMLDLDHFKLINDTYGHPAGDKALVMFSNMLRVAAPEHAIAGRYGGEEFCLLLPVESRKAARDIAREFVLRTRGVVVDTESGRIPMTVSIGAAVSPADGVNLDDLVAAADRRVYMAKEAGRDQAFWADGQPAVPSKSTPGKDADAGERRKAARRATHF
ncbi:MAG: GGDEF domain-containing protein [Burkholderiaceae bacterium]